MSNSFYLYNIEKPSAFDLLKPVNYEVLENNGYILLEHFVEPDDINRLSHIATPVLVRFEESASDETGVTFLKLSAAFGGARVRLTNKGTYYFNALCLVTKNANFKANSSNECSFVEYQKGGVADSELTAYVPNQFLEGSVVKRLVSQGLHPNFLSKWVEGKSLLCVERYK